MTSSLLVWSTHFLIGSYTNRIVHCDMGHEIVLCVFVFFLSSCDLCFQIFMICTPLVLEIFIFTLKFFKFLMDTLELVKFSSLLLFPFLFPFHLLYGRLCYHYSVVFSVVHSAVLGRSYCRPRVTGCLCPAGHRLAGCSGFKSCTSPPSRCFLNFF